MKKYIYSSIVILTMLLVSCNAQKDVVYLQDSTIDVPVAIENQKVLRAQPMDQLQIVVNSKDPETSAMFTLHQPTSRMYPSSSQSLKSTGLSSSHEIYLTSYQVSSAGTIDFPVLGEIKVEGLTRQQIAEKIKKMLVSQDLVKDPIVTVDFCNAQFTVSGEVARPGKYGFDRDQITLLEALGMAGDMTILGRRDNVKVIREENGKRTTHLVDLRSEKLFDSPVYYLKQNDVIYVEPNKVKAGQSTINENSWKSVSLWVSIASLLTSVAVLIFK